LSLLFWFSELLLSSNTCGLGGEIPCAVASSARAGALAAIKYRAILDISCRSFAASFPSFSSWRWRWARWTWRHAKAVFVSPPPCCRLRHSFLLRRLRLYNCRDAEQRRRSMQSQSLEEQILRAFKRAMNEGQQDVAEHLLRALEALGSEAVLESRLGEAYVLVAQHSSRKPPRGRDH